MGIGKVDPDFYVFYEDDPVIAQEADEERRKITDMKKQEYAAKA